MKSSLQLLAFVLPLGLLSNLAFATDIKSTATTGTKTCSTAPEEDFLLKVKDRFAVGEITRTDVASAELNVLDAKLHCQTLTKADYCQKAPAEADIQLYGMTEEHRTGVRTIHDVIVAQRQVRSITEFCEK